MSFYNVASLVLVPILFGCAQAPIKHSESIATKYTPVTFLLPSPDIAGGLNPSNAQNLAEKIIFKNSRNYGKKDSDEFSNLDAINWKVLNGGFSVENYKATFSRNTGVELNKVSVAYDGKIQMAKAGQHYQLTFLFEKMSYTAEQSRFSDKPRYQVSFSPNEITANLVEAEMAWKIEVDSKFNTESTYANFSRLARREALAGSGEIDSSTGTVIKEKFWVNVSGKDVSVKVVTYPYQNRSKVVVYANIPGSVTGKNSVDFVKGVEIFRKEIERIVNS